MELCISASHLIDNVQVLLSFHIPVFISILYSQDNVEDSPEEHEGEDECDHSFVLKDDLGYVCRICGVIQRGIETIIEYQYAKVCTMVLLESMFHNQTTIRNP